MFGGYKVEFYKVDFASPLGIMEITGTEEAIYDISFTDKKEQTDPLQEDTPTVLKTCYHQLDEYFKGERQTFSVPYIYEGTDFQESVWHALTEVDYGQTASYLDIARAVGREKAVRAVGGTNGKNKLSIIVPCHRIIGANGKMTGYASGVWRKEWLLEHEQKYLQGGVS